jgi:hypothetical protein
MWIWAQCALCKQALASGGQEGLIVGFKWSIVLLVSMPLVLVMGIGGMLVRSHRTRTRREGIGRE